MSKEFKDNDPRWKYRSVKDKESGTSKRFTRETAARLVSSGNYEYADDGPFDPDSIDAGWRRRLTAPPSTEVIIQQHLNFKDPPEKRANLKFNRLRTPPGVEPPVKPPIPPLGDIKVKPSPTTARVKAREASTKTGPVREVDMSKLSVAERKVLEAKKSAAGINPGPPTIQPGVVEGVNTLRSMIDRKRAERDAK